MLANLKKYWWVILLVGMYLWLDGRARDRNGTTPITTAVFSTISKIAGGAWGGFLSASDKTIDLLNGDATWDPFATRSATPSDAGKARPSERVNMLPEKFAELCKQREGTLTSDGKRCDGMKK